MWTGEQKAASVATRMSWMSEREMTRPDDIAYSMFGILDVAIEIWYGEYDNAFRRLQLTVIEESNDESFIAWEST